MHKADAESQLDKIHGGLAAGDLGWTVSLAVAFVFLAAIVGVYDHALHAAGREPLALKLGNDLSG